VTESPRGRADAATAGTLLVGAIVLCALVGLGAGALVGAPAPLAILGAGVGLVAGFWIVYSRFRDI
jgi:hypothetical protein